MAKKQRQDEEEDKLELEEEELENEEEEDEGVSDSEEESEQKIEEDSDEQDKESAAKDEDKDDRYTEEEREALRERRRREKKMRKERDKRERVLAQNLILQLQEENRNLKRRQDAVEQRFQNVDKGTLESELRELASVYNQAEAVMKQAVADGDGEKFIQAKKISDKTWARYNLLEAQKNQRPGTAQSQGDRRVAPDNDQSEKADVQAGASGRVVLGDNGKRLGIAWAKRNANWYDANGGNRESKLVQAIDADLYEEGYDPETQEYWDELTDRAKEIPTIARHFKAAQRKKPPQLVGGSGRDGSSSQGSEKSLPKEFVQTLKAAGYWDDAVKRKAAIKNYYEQARKGA